MKCNWKYVGQDYGRGSRDWDNYRCLTCNAEIRVLESDAGQDSLPTRCRSPEEKAKQKLIEEERKERAELARLKAKYED